MLLLAVAYSAGAAGGPTVLVSAPTGVSDPNTDAAAFKGMSADGSRVFFETAARLSADDNDSGRVDVYERSGGVTTLVSQPGGDRSDPNTGDAFFAGASKDGSRVFLETTQQLTDDDTDNAHVDVYERAGAVTTLVSAATGISDPNAADVTYAGASADGAHVFLKTRQQLTADDANATSLDVYERAGGVTRLVSQPTALNDTDAQFLAASPNGERVYFGTTRKLTADDLDSARFDIYERTGGNTTLVSRATGVPDPDTGGPNYQALSADGATVFFETGESLTPDDTDTGQFDVYAASGGVTRLISATEPSSADIRFAGISDDGTHVYVTSFSALTADDHDIALQGGQQDVYEYSGGALMLVSQPTRVTGETQQNALYAGCSSDGSRVFFETAERMAPDDNDSARTDVYGRSGDVTTLLSEPTGVADPDTANALFDGASKNGDHIFFDTVQRLTPDDNDTFRSDIYERSGSVTTLISKPNGVPDPDVADARFRATSTLGSVAVFTSTERLTTDDADGGLIDLYMSPAPVPDQPTFAPTTPGTADTPGLSADASAPRLTALAVIPRRVKRVSMLPRLGAGTKQSRISFRTSKPARVTISFERQRPGRRSGGRCLATRRAAQRDRRCTRYLKVTGAIKVAAALGSNLVRFGGRIDRRRLLEPGPYRVTAQAADAAGKRSLPSRTSFTLLASSRQRR